MGMKPKVLVCQHGARHRYAIPRMLEEAGMLAALYTDSCVLSSLGRLAHTAKRMGICFSGISALASRNPIGIPKEKIFSTDHLTVALFRRRHAHPLSTADDLAPVFEKWGTQGANTVYTINTADLPFLVYAKKNGLRIIVDVFVNPLTESIINEEQMRFAGQQGSSFQERIELMRQRYLKTFRVADILLCPSAWVAEGCISLAPEVAHKIRLCPYGSSIEVHSAAPPSALKSKKVLFAGRDALRKGLPYLAAAAAAIKSQVEGVEILIAGLTRSQCAWIPFAEELNFLGNVPLDKMRQLFESSAVFVLPSLSEGQAGVVIEALSAGCPVVVTRECGVDIENGKQGFIVPGKDSDAISTRILEILRDARLQERMSAEAFEFAQQFTMDAWKNRLGAILHDVF